MGSLMNDSIRVSLIDRSDSQLYPLVYSIEESSDLYFETIMPGGMTLAGCSLPWKIIEDKPRIQGCLFLVYYNTSIIWWGRAYDVSDVVRGGDRKISIHARGPWELAARKSFTQAYQASSHDATSIISSAIFGNVEDILIDDSNWSVPGLTISPISFSGASIQTVVGDCLRFGDTTTTPWSFVILPPKTRPAYTGATFSSTCSSTGSFTGTGGTAPTAVTDVYMRGGSSIKCSAPASGTSSIYITPNGGTANVYYAASAWFYIPNNRPAEEYDLISFQTAAAANVVGLRLNGTWDVYAYNYHTTTSYTSTGPTILGSGCWHYLSLFVYRHATSGAVYVQLDGKSIINAANVDTGDTNLNRVTFGPIRTATNARILYLDNVGILAADTTVTEIPMKNSNYATETLPEAKIISLNTSTYDFIVSLSDIADNFELSTSLQQVSNQIDVTYSSGSILSLATNATSVARYGQLWSAQTVNKTSACAAVEYLRDRYIAQYAEPQPMLQSFTLTSPPQSINGDLYPLAKIRAGLVFRIREMPSLGNMYIGQTRYTRSESQQKEACQITPFGPAATLDVVLAQKLAKTWS